MKLIFNKEEYLDLLAALGAADVHLLEQHQIDKDKDWKDIYISQIQKNLKLSQKIINALNEEEE